MQDQFSKSVSTYLKGLWEGLDKNAYHGEERVDALFALGQYLVYYHYAEISTGLTTPIETGHFQLQRNGRDQLSGSDKFDITWKTIDEIKVTIRISKADNGASKLVRFNIKDYDNLTTKEELIQKIISAWDLERMEFNTTNNAAANEVFGIENQGKYYLLKTNLSKTLHSHVGTTVILEGEYKF